MSKCVFCFIYYNCIIILLSVTVFVCHDKGNVFLYNKFTSICILETSKRIPAQPINVFFCYIGDPDVISKLCYDHIPPAHKHILTSCYDRTTSVSIVSVSFALCAASGGLV